jgi:hypothetical protein
MTKETYYLNYDNRKKLFELWKNRELCTIGYVDKKVNVFRHHFLYNIEYCDLTFKNLDIYNMNNNMYYSSAKYKFIPKYIMGRDVFNNWVIMNNEAFNLILKDNIMCYDLLLDFDMKKTGELELMHNEVLMFCGILNENDIKYYITESSLNPNGTTKNIHITIPFDVLKLPFLMEGDVLIYYRDMLYKLKKVFDLKHCDLALAGVFNRVQKSPLSVYDNIGILHFLEPQSIGFISHDNLFMINKYKNEIDFKKFYNKFLRNIDINEYLKN